MGDFTDWVPTLGNFGLGKANNREEKLLEFEDYTSSQYAIHTSSTRNVEGSRGHLQMHNTTRAPGARRSPEVARVSSVASCLWQTHGICYQFKQLGGSACDDV